MNNEFVPYDIALAMKELGFDDACIFYYAPDAITISKPTTGVCSSDRYRIIASPLYQQAFRWFREKYKLFGELALTTKQEDVEVFEFFVLNVNEPLFESDDYTVYEEAELACLRKLIEIVNQNKDENN